MVKKAISWYNQRQWAAVLGIVALVLAVLIAMRSLDTGSWQQYGMAFVLLIFGCNRLIHAVRRRAHA
jgi:uncharacterized membrane protein HdeD (DUF308 family)